MYCTNNSSSDTADWSSVLTLLTVLHIWMTAPSHTADSPLTYCWQSLTLLTFSRILLTFLHMLQMVPLNYPLPYSDCPLHLVDYSSYTVMPTITHLLLTGYQIQIADCSLNVADCPSHTADSFSSTAHCPSHTADNLSCMYCSLSLILLTVPHIADIPSHTAHCPARSEERP